MQTKKRGRPRQFAGGTKVNLREAELAYVRGQAEREDRSIAAVCRQLICEAIASKAQPRKGKAK